LSRKSGLTFSETTSANMNVRIWRS